MIKKICPDCHKEMVQLKHSKICACGPKIVIRAKKDEIKAS